MERHKAKLLITVLVMFGSLLPLAIISTATHNYVEGTVNVTSPFTVCIAVRYGLYEFCEAFCNGTGGGENCTGIEFDMMHDLTKSYAGNPQLEMGFFFAFLGIGVIVWVACLVPFCIRVRENYLNYALGIFGACGILCIVFVCLFANDSIDPWEDRAGSSGLTVTLDRSYSFVLHIVFCSVMIVSTLVGFGLLHDYAEHQM